MVIIVQFPSPYGVSFILIFPKKFLILIQKQQFPSPYGVSFILIFYYNFSSIYIHIYVSVSLRSIIHSYFFNWLKRSMLDDQRFRLLTEYHSFLLKVGKIYEQTISMFPSPYGVSFILIDIGNNICLLSLEQFPSPYGVSFILIYDG